MKRCIFMILLTIASNGFLLSQEFDFDVQFRCDSLQYGYGIEGRINLFKCSGAEGVRFIVKTPDPIQWQIQPDTLYAPGASTISITSGEPHMNGIVSLKVIGIRQSDSVKKTFNINVFEDADHPSYVLAKTFLQQSVEYLKVKFPELTKQFSEIDTSELFCYHPFPPLDIVRHTVLLQKHWRITAQEHVMVPPYNWKRVFLWNESSNLYFGLEIDTEGELSLIPCQVKYYFEETNYLPLEINLSNSSIREDNEPNALIGALSTTDNFDTLSYQYRIVNGTAPFLISNENELKAAAVFDYDMDTVQFVDILSRNEMGYGLAQTFAVSVLPKSVPTGIHGYPQLPIGYRISNNHIYFEKTYDAIEVYDITGRMIRSRSNTSNINLEGLGNKILLLKLHHSSSVSSLKIFVFTIMVSVE